MTTEEEDDEDDTPMPAQPTSAPATAPVSAPAVIAAVQPSGDEICPGSFFCMSKSTFTMVTVLLVLVCVLAGVGWWYYKKNAGGNATNAGNNVNNVNAGNDFDLGDLGRNTPRP